MFQMNVLEHTWCWHIMKLLFVMHQETILIISEF